MTSRTELPERTPAQALCEAIELHKGNAMVQVTPLKAVLPLVSAHVRDSDRRIALLESAVTVLAAVALDRHYGRTVMQPLQLQTLELIAGHPADHHEPTCGCPACFIARRPPEGEAHGK